MSLTAGVPGNVPVLIIMGTKGGGGPFMGFEVELETPSAVLLIFAMAPCTQA